MPAHWSSATPLPYEKQSPIAVLNEGLIPDLLPGPRSGNTVPHRPMLLSVILIRVEVPIGLVGPANLFPDDGLGLLADPCSVVGMACCSRLAVHQPAPAAAAAAAAAASQATCGCLMSEWAPENGDCLVSAITAVPFTR